MFLNDLQACFISGQNRIKLISPLIYWSERYRQEIVVPTGFISNGANIPRSPLWSIIGHPFDKELRAAAVLHDFLYRCLVNKGFTRKQADQTFYDALRSKGVGYIKAQAMWQAVRIFGKFAIKGELI